MAKGHGDKAKRLRAEKEKRNQQPASKGTCCLCKQRNVTSNEECPVSSTHIIL